MWRDSNYWSSWVCWECNCECSDPDTITITTCPSGHVNYLGPSDKHYGNRKAYRSSRARLKDIREHNALVKEMSLAVEKVEAVFKIAKS